MYCVHCVPCWLTFWGHGSKVNVPTQEKVMIFFLVIFKINENLVWNVLRWVVAISSVFTEIQTLEIYTYFCLDCFCYPRPVLAFGYCRCLRLSVCVCVRPCVNHELVRAITHDPYQLGSPNLDRKCKRPWLRSLLFLGVIDLDLQGQI